MGDRRVLIEYVQPGSIAEEAGIEQGDILLALNGEKVQDVFDYRFLMANEELLIEIEKKNGEIWEVEIEKDEYEDLGLEFAQSMIDDAKSCTNKCIFCFIDQLPEGMRETLYFKDDDSRLSFLTGNYVTLTNMNDDDMARIIKYRMSPINISVHTTNPDLRTFMLKNRFAGNISERIKSLVDKGITVNCQIVLCRHINDGRELDRTISDLSSLYPGIGSISVVPVGITRHREGLCLLLPYDMEASREVVRQVKAWQKKLLKRYGSRVVYLADEFYIMAKTTIPRYEEYEDFPQIENGVGLIALLTHEFNQFVEDPKAAELKLEQARNVSIATGVSAYGYIKAMAESLEKRYDNLRINVYEIKNDYFGENVTVAGLLTGTDIVALLGGQELGQELLVSSSMLRSGEDVLLDDYTLGMLEQHLKVKVTAVDNNGSDFVLKVLGKDY